MAELYRAAPAAAAGTATIRGDTMSKPAATVPLEALPHNILVADIKQVRSLVVLRPAVASTSL